jgi:iron(III) transport system permease protein
VVLAVPFALPFLYLIVRNAGDLSGLWAALTDADTIAPAFRSLLLGTAVAVTAGIIGTGAAWMVARTDLRSRRTWALLLCLPLVIPSFVGAVALIAAYSPGGLLSQMLGNAVPMPSVSGFWGSYGVLTLLT